MLIFFSKKIGILGSLVFDCVTHTWKTNPFLVYIVYRRKKNTELYPFISFFDIFNFILYWFCIFSFCIFVYFLNKRKRENQLLLDMWSPKRNNKRKIIPKIPRHELTTWQLFLLSYEMLLHKKINEMMVNGNAFTDKKYKICVVMSEMWR